jgi:hypothetical protein
MSTNRFIVAPGQEFSYPADPSSVQIVKNAGGISNLTPEQRKMVRFKTVTPGQDCSDMPSGSLAIFVSRGWVLEEAVKTEPKEDSPVVDEEGDI